MDQELINYVSENRRLGIPDEDIRKALLGVGWTEEQISAAFAYRSVNKAVNIADKNILAKSIPATEFKKSIDNGRGAAVSSGKSHRGLFVVIILLLIIMIAGGIFVYVYYFSGKFSEQNLEMTNEPVFPNNNEPQINTSDTSIKADTSLESGIERVKTILEDMKSGVLAGNYAVVSRYASSETSPFVASSTFSSINGFNVNSVVQYDKNIVANFTATSTNGASFNQDIVFIKEGDYWKFDFPATMQWSNERINSREDNSGGNSNAFSDLVVTDVIIYPSHPVINDRNVKVDVLIKNIGTKIADKVPLKISLIGFAKEFTVQGLETSPILPGEAVVWTLKPYVNNLFFNVNDIPGQKTIQVTVNQDREIEETDYDNNIFTQTFKMYAE